MTSHAERQRLAAMAAALRPDWPVNSLYTLLTDDVVLVKRSYQDVALALAWVGTDPATKTPARLAQPGPWWAATTAASVKAPTSVAARRCGECGGFHTPLSPHDPPEQARSHGRGAELARQALTEAQSNETNTEEGVPHGR